MSLFEDISKKVGWNKRNVEYPTVAEVRQALYRKNEQDIFNLIMWHRNLKPAETTRQTQVLNLIDNGLETMVL